jgi:hypothetical protein
MVGMEDMVSVGWQWASKTPRCHGNSFESLSDAIMCAHFKLSIV